MVCTHAVQTHHGSLSRDGWLTSISSWSSPLPPHGARADYESITTDELLALLDNVLDESHMRDFTDQLHQVALPMIQTARETRQRQISVLAQRHRDEILNVVSLLVSAQDLSLSELSDCKADALWLAEQLKTQYQKSQEIRERKHWVLANLTQLVSQITEEFKTTWGQVQYLIERASASPLSPQQRACVCDILGGIDEVPVPHQQVQNDLRLFFAHLTGELRYVVWRECCVPSLVQGHSCAMRVTAAGGVGADETQESL